MSYLSYLVHFFDLSTPVGNPDLGIPGRNPAVGANIASNPPGVGGGICAEFNGNNSNYNCGDIVELNAVQQFTIAFWMNQDVIDADDELFIKYLDGTNNVRIRTVAADGNMYIEPNNGGAQFGYFDYSTVINVGQWHHVAVVFDGSQADNASRLVCYVDGVLIALLFLGTIQATLADLSGVDAYIGYIGATFDGKLDTFMLFNAALTNLQVTDLRNRTRRGQL